MKKSDHQLPGAELQKSNCYAKIKLWMLRLWFLFLLNKILIRKRHSLCSLVLTKSKFCDFLHQLFTHVVEKLLIRIISFHSYSIICICNSFCYDHFKYKHRICIILSSYLAEKCENICCLTGYVNPQTSSKYNEVQ